MRRLAAGAIGGVIVLAASAVVAWMAFQRIPSWYTPRDVTQAELSRVRNSLPNIYQELSDRIVEGKPFTFVLSDEAVTEWIVARAELYPDARDWLPDWIEDPVVSFTDRRCIFGGRVSYEGWQTIIGVHLVADITDEKVTIRVDKLSAGALPVPLSQLADPLERLLHDARLDVEAMPDPAAAIVRKLRSAGVAEMIEKGVSWHNLFRSRNGRREVKIRAVSARGGQLRVRIEPLPP